MKKYIKPSKYANMISLSKKTVYVHFHDGLIPGYQDKNTGTIYLENPEFNQNNNRDDDLTKVVLYARTSSSQNRQLVEDQLSRLRQYATSKGYTIVREIKEFGSRSEERRVGKEVRTWL